MSIERVLDIGIGESNHLGIYANSEYSVVGIDPRSDVADRARQTMHGEFVYGYGERLPFRDASFDKVYSLMTLEHVNDPAHVLKEAKRVLIPGGKLIADVPHPRYEKVMSHITNGYCKDLHKRVFEPDEFKVLIETAGFNVSEMSPRMWHAAIKFSALWLRARFSGQLDFDHDTGELLNRLDEDKQTHDNSGIRNSLNKLLWLAENKDASPKRFFFLTPLRIMNNIYPWATYIEAIKQ